tara:strand:+ start:1863 stop:3167 length:1305 start_codon:yes stop_codon:yes gene_type:complete
MKKLLLGILLSTSLFSQDFVLNFFKYSTAYASFSLNAPRYQEDRFRITGGLDTGELEVERDEREFQPDFQKAFGIRKIGRFKYEPKRGVKNAGVGGTWYDGSENNTNEGANIGVVKGWEYLIKFTEGRQWGNDYLNQEYWLRYTSDWWVMKYGYTQLGLEDVEYMQGDLRLKYTPDLLDVFGNSFDEVTFSVGLKHRQHPVYGFDAMVLDTSWYRGSWWDFAEDAFGWDDHRWYIGDENNQGGTLVYWDAMTESYIPVPGDGPFFNGNGEFIGYDYFWETADGEIMAWSDREFFLYHFPALLDGYIEDFKNGLGYQRETSIVIGMDMYHYADNWWFHSWVNWLPYHYGHDSYSYHNATHYQKHLDKGMESYNFMYMEPMWAAWNDFDFGSIIGVKLMDNVGIFAEGSYLYYWGRPAYNFKFGLNYQFLGFTDAK